MITQTVARKIRLSDNALAFIVIALVLLMALGAEFFTALIGSRKVLIAFYLVLIVICCWVVMRRSVSFRYGVDGTFLYLDKIVGRKEKSMDQIGRKEITGFYAPGEYTKQEGEITLKCTVLKKETAYTLCYARNGKKYRLLFHPNEKIIAALTDIINK